MAATARPRPCVELDIHDDSLILGELPLGNIQNVKQGIRHSSVESLVRQLDSFHLHSVDKENKLRPAPKPASQTHETALRAGDANCENIKPPSVGASVTPPDPENFEKNNLLALASQNLPSAQHQLSKHHEGQFEWLLSVPVKAAPGSRPRADSHDDAELARGEKTLYFGCNLVRRRTQSGGALGEDDKPTDVYTLLATRVEGENDFAMHMDAEIARLQSEASQPQIKEVSMGERQNGGLDVPPSPGLLVDIKDYGHDAIVEERSRPVSRIEDSVEALDKLEEEIEALAEVAQLERVLSPEALAQKTDGASAKSTPMKRATSVRLAPNSAKARTVERSSSVRKSVSTSTKEDAQPAVVGSAGKVPRPTSLLPPKPPAKSSKPSTVPAFELPGEAVARRLKEQREQRRSQQITPEQQAATAAAFSPSKPHFKSSKPPTRPTFELPGEAISRKKREEREAKLRAQEEEERKRREFKARPIRASLVVPYTVPRDTLASLARQKARQTEGSSDSNGTTITPTSSKKRLSMAFPPSSTSRPQPSTATPTATAATPSRGRNQTSSTSSDQPMSISATSTSRATSTSAASTRSGTSLRSRHTNSSTTHNTSTTSSRRSTVLSSEDLAQQRQRGKDVLAKDRSFAAEREREKRERENAAREARREAAERSRMLSREWAEKRKNKKKKGGSDGEGARKSEEPQVEVEGKQQQQQQGEVV
ncbi:hypothetical protein VTI74DRAFT_5521 [Chaetomium olivicolor]